MHRRVQICGGPNLRPTFSILYLLFKMTKAWYWLPKVPLLSYGSHHFFFKKSLAASSWERKFRSVHAMVHGTVHLGASKYIFF